ncbi:GntR family transcriptional regulator [Streptomyces sp. NPDC088707]|uniref:GntR family transcriptional regulator n=1 Tax=Streptomyces sp. NPDC088707 TaxID=3365871 RepID=UPI003808AEED
MPAQPRTDTTDNHITGRNTAGVDSPAGSRTPPHHEPETPKTTAPQTITGNSFNHEDPTHHNPPTDHNTTTPYTPNDNTNLDIDLGSYELIGMPPTSTTADTEFPSQETQTPQATQIPAFDSHNATALATALDGWHNEPGTVSQRLANQLRKLIKDGRLQPGTTLPPQRTLAAALSALPGAPTLSQKPVSSAYSLLRGEGLLQGTRGSGTRVNPLPLPPMMPAPPTPAPSTGPTPPHWPPHSTAGRTNPARPSPSGSPTSSGS